jgi:hypothetical protein
MHEISPVASNDDTPRTRRSRQQAARY